MTETTTDQESKIIAQVEFYFSDTNLWKDKLLQKLVEQEPEGYVPIATIADFNRMKALRVSLEAITKAIRSSSKLVVSPDGTLVKRKIPLPPKNQEKLDQCTVYVENLPADTNHESFAQLFGKCGTVTYVSLPRFTSKKLKGFGFVEFADNEAAVRAIAELGGDKENELRVISKAAWQQYVNEYKETFGKRNRKGTYIANFTNLRPERKQRQKERKIKQPTHIFFESEDDDENLKEEHKQSPSEKQ